MIAVIQRPHRTEINSTRLLMSRVLAAGVVVATVRIAGHRRHRIPKHF